MTRTRLSVCAALLSAFVLGCGGAEPKKIPEPTAEQKQEASKAHEQAKSHAQGGGGGTAPANPGTPAEPPK